MDGKEGRHYVIYHEYSETISNSHIVFDVYNHALISKRNSEL